MSAQLAAQRRGGDGRQLHAKIGFAENAQGNAGGFKVSARAMKRSFIGYFAKDKMGVRIKLPRKSQGGFNRGMEGLNGALSDGKVASGDDVQVRRFVRILNLREGLHTSILERSAVCVKRAWWESNPQPFTLGATALPFELQAQTVVTRDIIPHDANGKRGKIRVLA